jgi:hypothetical protein
LLGQARLDRHAATVAMRHHVGVRLDLVEQAASSIISTISLRAAKRSLPSS